MPKMFMWRESYRTFSRLSRFKGGPWWETYLFQSKGQEWFRVLFTNVKGRMCEDRFFAHSATL